MYIIGITKLPPLIYERQPGQQRLPGRAAGKHELTKLLIVQLKLVDGSTKDGCQLPCYSQVPAVPAVPAVSPPKKLLPSNFASQLLVISTPAALVLSREKFSINTKSSKHNFLFLYSFAVSVVGARTFTLHFIRLES